MRSARYPAVYRMDTFINFLIVPRIRYNNNNHDDDDDDIDHIDIDNNPNFLIPCKLLKKKLVLFCGYI